MVLKSWEFDLTKTEQANALKKLLDDGLKDKIEIKAFVAMSTEDFAQIIFTIRERLDITKKQFCHSFGISKAVLNALEEAKFDWKVIRDIFSPDRDHKIALAPKDGFFKKK